MLENIRKYTWLMAAVFILLGAGLVFTMNESNTSLTGSADGTPVMGEAYNSSFTQKQVDREGTRALGLAQQLGMQDFLVLSGDFMNPDPMKFFATRQIIRKEAANYGIYPSRADIEKHIKEKVFVDEKGDFNQETYASFIETVNNRLGMGENDVEKLFSDHLRLQSLQKLISNGIEPSASMEKSLLQDRQQQIVVDKVEFKLSDYLSKVEPSDEEIEQYWKEHTDSYMTDEQRKVTYLLAKPDFSSLPEETDENKEELKTQRETIKKQLSSKVDQLWQIIYDTEGREFEAKAKEAGFEVKTTELFSAATAPAEIRLTLRGLRGQTVVTNIFAMENSDDPQEQLSDVLPAGQDQWLIYKLNEIVISKPKEFAGAKEQAKKDLIEQKARELMSEDATKAHEAIAKSLEAGQSFVDAAKAVNYTPVKLGPFTSRDSLPQDSNARTVFFNARRTNVGELSDLVSEPEAEPNRMLILHVEKRELVKSESFDQQIDSSMSAAKSRYSYILFQNWLSEKYEQNIKTASSPNNG